MKKIIIAILITLFLISACGDEAPVEGEATTLSAVTTTTSPIVDDTAEKISTTTKTLVTTTMATTTTEKKCVAESSEEIKYSFEYTERKEVEMNQTTLKRLQYDLETIDVRNYERKGAREYAFFWYDHFTELAKNMKITGMYKDSKILEFTGYLTAQEIEIVNEDEDYGGLFTVERRFTSFKDDGYYLRDSPNIQTVYIDEDDSGTVIFDQSVVCYVLAEIEEEANLMPFFVTQSDIVGNQKDFIVHQMDGLVFTCERAKFRIIPPLVANVTKINMTDDVLINEQGKDDFITFNTC